MSGSPQGSIRASSERRTGYFDMNIGPTDQFPRAPSSFTDESRHAARDNRHVEAWLRSNVQAEQPQPQPSRTERWKAYMNRKFPRRIVRRVLKCTLAFFLSTLFTLILPVAHALGSAPFLTTTGMLFSHPGRTMGAQFDTTLMALGGVMLGIGWALAAIAVPNTIVSNAVFLFFGILFAQMLRQWMPKFFFFSLHFMVIQIFGLTVPEDSAWHPFLIPVQYGAPLLIGCFISLIVNLLVWPETAVDSLGRAVRETLDSQQEMLQLVARLFFLEDMLVSEEKVNAAAGKMRQAIVKVRTAYREAKYEVSYSWIRPQELGPFRKSLERLTRHLSALSGSLRSERELFHNALASLRRNNNGAGVSTSSSTTTSVQEEEEEEEEKGEERVEEAAGKSSAEKQQHSLRQFLAMPRLSTPKPKPPQRPRKKQDIQDERLLVAYLEGLRDPLTQLSHECATVLECVRTSILHQLLDVQNDSWLSWFQQLVLLFKRKRDQNQARSDPYESARKMHESLHRFDAAEQERVNHLTRQDGLDLKIREELFLVFFFIFTLREVAKELETLARHTADLQRKKRRHVYMPRLLTLSTLRKWVTWNNHQNVRDKGGYSHAVLAQYMPKEENPNLEEEYRKFKGSTRRGSQQQQDLRRPSATLLHLEKELSSLRREASSPPDQDVEHDKPPLLLRVRYGLWYQLQFFKKYEFKFALKTAVAVFVLCVWAFIPSTAAWFNREKGQWASITVIAIMNPTSGGTVHASAWRIVGTVIGALVGWAALETGSGSPYVLAIFAVLLAIPFFYIHLGSTYNKVGIVVLISYNVVALARYANASPGATIATTVWHRAVTVMIGIVVAMILNAMVWPFVARHATRKTMSFIFGRLGEYYGYLVGTFLYQDPTVTDIKQALKQENKIQTTINTTNLLLSLTDHEPRLKAPFPKSFYKEMIASAQNILDHLGSIRMALQQMPTIVKQDVCHAEYHWERRDMIASMMLHFYMLSSSLASKIPLPSYMPSTRAARNRVLGHRREEADDRWVKFRNLSWYAMASSSEEIIGELEHLTRLVRFIVGEAKYGKRAQQIDAVSIQIDSRRRRQTY